MNNKRIVEIDELEWYLPFKATSNGDVIDAKGKLIAGSYCWNQVAECIATALNNYYQWKYPEKGELPDMNSYYQVTLNSGVVLNRLWSGRMIMRELHNVRAFCNPFKPAPALQEEKINKNKKL